MNLENKTLINSRYIHFYPKNVSMVIFPVSIARINRAMMYVKVNEYKHPVIVNNNHFTMPLELQKIIKEKSLRNIELSPLIPKDDYYFFVGCFVLNKLKKKTRYYVTIDRKIRELLKLKEKDVVEIKINGKGPFYGRTWWQINRNSMFIFFPRKIFELSELESKIPYQICIKKSNKKIVSNLHFYATEKTKLEFSNFVEHKFFNLHRFLKFSYACTRGGNIRKFHIKPNDNKIHVYYYSGGPKTKEIELKSVFLVNGDFFRIMGLIQAEASKSVKKAFCLTNEIPENIRYITDWFEENLQVSKNSWIYELSLDPREMKNKERAKEFWSKSLNVPLDLIKVYPKVSQHTNKPKKLGIMNLKTKGRVLKEIILRLLESVREYVTRNKEGAGYFISGVLAGDGYTINTKGNSLDYVGISFDPNKIWNDKENELLLYIKCLGKIGISKDHIRIYVNKHPKVEKFIKKVSGYGIKIKVHKGNSLGFGATLIIFRYKNFMKLLDFKPFYPNLENERKFFSGFNKINKNRIR